MRLAYYTGRNDFVGRYGDTGEDEFAVRGGTIPQRLLLMNGKLVREKTKDDLFNASRRIAELAPDDPKAIEVAYLTVLTRRPAAEELAHFEGRLAGTKGQERQGSAHRPLLDPVQHDRILVESLNPIGRGAIVMTILAPTDHGPPRFLGLRRAKLAHAARPGSGPAGGAFTRTCAVVDLALAVGRAQPARDLRSSSRNHGRRRHQGDQDRAVRTFSSPRGSTSSLTRWVPLPWSDPWSARRAIMSVERT